MTRNCGFFGVTVTLKIVERYQGPEQGAAYVKHLQEQKKSRVVLTLKPEQVIS